MRVEAHISPTPQPDDRRAIELAIAAAAREAEASATRSRWWHAGLAEQLATGSATTLRRAPRPGAGRAAGAL